MFFVSGLVVLGAVGHASNIRILLLILVMIAVALLIIGMVVALLTLKNMRKL